MQSLSSLIAHNCKLTADDGNVFEDPTLYKSTIGVLQYLTLTRPDIAFAVNKLSQFLSSPSQLHWLAVKRVLRFFRGTINTGLVFRLASKLSFECFADANWAGDVNNRKSTDGHYLYLGSSLVS